MLVKDFATSKMGIMCINHPGNQTSLHMGRNDVILTPFETKQKHKLTVQKNMWKIRVHTPLALFLIQALSNTTPTS